MPPANLVIRPTTDADTPAFVRMRNQPLNRFYTLAQPFESVELWRNRMKTNTPEKTINLGAFIGGRMVGTAGLYRNNPGRREHVASFGISLDDSFHNQGIGTALTAALMDIADNWLNLRRVELNVFTDNAGAIHLYKKFGFVTEGTLVAATFRDSTFVDSHIMARVQPDLAADNAPYPPAPPPAPATPYTLRAAEPEDRDAITALMNLPLVRHGTLRHPHSVAAQNNHLASPPAGTTSILAVTETNDIIGAASLTAATGRRAHTGDISMMAVHDAHHRQGVGQTMLGALLNLADNWLNLTRLTLTVFADNEPAVALYTRYGFTPEATRKADAFRAGGYCDGLAMARRR